MKEFKSIAAFCRHLEAQIPKARITMHVALFEAGAMVQDEAKAEVGHYQSAAGPFQEWPPLAETTLEGFTDPVTKTNHPGKIELGFAPPDNPLKATGALRDAISLSVSAIHAVVGVPSKTVGSGDEGDHVRNIGDVAVDHEFGTDRMPARSFLGRALFVRAHEVREMIAHAAVAAISGRAFDPKKHKRAAGSGSAEDIPF